MFQARAAFAVLFASSIFNSFLKKTGLPSHCRHRRQRRSFKTFLSQAVSLALIVSILSLSTPAAPQTGLLASLGELGQDIRYSYLANSSFSDGGLPEISFADLSDNLSLSAFLINPVFGLITGGILKGGKGRQENRAAAVTRIEIAPGQATIREGEQIALTAVGYDEKGIPVQGVGYNWMATPLPLTDASAAQLKIPAEGAGVAEPLPNGVFDPDYPGIYTITAQASGSNLTSSIRVTVVPDAALKALKEKTMSASSGEGKAGGMPLKRATGKPKALRSAVTDLMAQPLPATVNNSTRMTKETVKDLEKWDDELKQQQKKTPAEAMPSLQPKGVGQVNQADSANTKESTAVALSRTSGLASKGGPSAAENSEESEAITSAMTAGGQITGIDPNTRVVTGWVYNSSYPSAYIYIDGTYQTSVSPNCPQGSGTCSFSYTISDNYVDNIQHTLSATTYDWSTYTNVPLSGSPQTFTFNLVPTPQWNKLNWYTADDPGLQPGLPANTGTSGAGSENFSFSAPVVSLGGRGLNVNLSLSYNSLVWHQENGEITYDIDKGNPGPGWSLLGIGKMMDMSSTGGAMLEDIDGTRHSYDGTIQAGYYQGTSTYYGHTTDGSFIDYVANKDNGGIAFGKAYFPNGTIIDYGAAADNVAYPTQIKDRSGNYITIAYVNNQGPNISTITDTEGRVIQFQYDAYNYLLSVSGPAINPTGIGQNQNATQTYVRIHHRHQPITTNFSGLNTLIRNSNPYVIDAIYYPGTNTGYWFGDQDSYSTYGMIAKVIEQRGMSWTAGATGQEQGTFTPGVMTRQMTYNYPLTAGGAALTSAPQYTSMTEDWAGRDVPTPAVTTYSVNNNGTPRTTSVALPNGNTIKQSSYNHPGVWDDGLLYQVETVSPANLTLAKTNTVWALGDYGSPRVTEAYSTDELNQTTKQTFDYGNNLYNQVTTAYQYGFSNNLLRKTAETYENSSNYTGTYSGTIWNSGYNAGRHIFSLVKTEEVFDASNTRLRRTDYTYDGVPLMDTPGVVSYDQYYNTTASYYAASAVYRGNVTNTTVYADAQNLAGAIPYDSTYDVTGNARTITTNCCQQMSFGYTSNTQYSQPETHTKGSSDPNSPDRMTESAVYDFNTGTPVHTTDFNGRQSTHFYDVNLRPVQEILPSGGKTTIVYDDANLSVTQTSQLADNTIAAKSAATTNGRGQTLLSQQWTGAGWNASAVKYDVMGRKSQESLPFDAAGQPSQWTSYQYDQLSRVTQTTAPDGSTTKTFYNETQKPDSASAYPGNFVRSQDAWGRERWARTDDFGRLAEVVEPNPAGSGAVIGTGSAGSLQTLYHHDQVDQLVGVTQGAQNRWFAYDSLGRLTRQKLAESAATINGAGTYVGAGGAGAQWSDAFTYDQRSNLTQRVDARGVKTNFNYLTGAGSPDPLNRLLSVSYDKSQADQTYPIYDAQPVTLDYMTSGDKTRVWKATTAYTDVEENAYDIEGRISDYTQTFYLRSNSPLQTSYLYDSLNRLTEARYPAEVGIAGSPRKTVNPVYDEASRLKELKADGSIQMSEIVYNPLSQVTQLKTGAATNNADVETYTYDQPTGLLTNQKVKKANSNQTLLDLTYEYNRGGSSGNGANPYGKTGQLTHIVNNLDRNKDRVFEFDALGRLRTAKGGAATGVQNVQANWTQQYAYDRYGNRTSVTAAGITANSQNVPTDGLANQSYDSASNRISTAGYTYDLAGNLTRGQDASGNWQRYEYDAAGRLIAVKNDAGTFTEQFNYYASGRERLISSSDAAPGYTFYVWGGASVIAEYAGTTDTNVPLSWKKSYVYAGSRLLSTSTNNGSGGETLEFHHPDRLGTKVVTNDVAGTSFEQSTLPFGTELSAEASGTNTTNQKFTSYDRSAVANLDYAVNRSYSAGQGRFTQPDPIGMSSTSIGDPQSMNQYAYTQNNPVDFTDPSGLFKLAKKEEPKDDAPIAVVTIPISFDDDAFTWGGNISDNVYYLPILPLPNELGISGGGIDNDDKRKAVQNSINDARNLIRKKACADFLKKLLIKTSEFAVYFNSSHGYTTVFTGGFVTDLNGNPDINIEAATINQFQNALDEGRINLNGGSGKDGNAVTYMTTGSYSTVTVNKEFYDLGNTARAQNSLHESLHQSYGYSDFALAGAAYLLEHPKASLQDVNNNFSKGKTNGENVSTASEYLNTQIDKYCN